MDFEEKDIPESAAADSPSVKQEKNDTRELVLSTLRDVVCVLSAILLLFTFCIRMVIVSGTSMCDTLENGDYLLVIGNLFYRDPQPGDIVVACKDSFRDGEPIIKRVIATEGQTVDIDFAKGIVYVDGEALNEPYVSTYTNISEGGYFPQVVEKGHVFVMGDNRNDSLDSRSPEIGQLDHRQILGRAVFLLFPGANRFSGKLELERIGVLDNG
jgi:signal peptidase I